MTALHTGPDGQLRCTWCAATPDYIAYHDEEWGFPVADDRRLFEKLSLEAFQSGLSWRTILTKRANFRAGFAGFDIEVLATWGEAEVQRLLGDAGIVRHRGKIEAVLNNARRAQELIRDEGSLAAYVWRHEPTRDDPPEAGPVVGQTAVSQAISKDLKRRGWAFVGPTTVYAFMQAMGLVNDHATGCAWRARVTPARRAFQRPV